MQAIICYIVALFLGLPLSVHILYSFVILIPAAIFAISLGMIIGSLMNENQVAGFGSAFITITQLFSGAWMDLKMVGGIFEKVGMILPFSHSIDAVRAIMAGNYIDIIPHLYWIIGYLVVGFVAAIFSFKFAMKR
jgi:ABC-2 type transport system permease protein